MKSNTEIPTNLANIRRRLNLPDIDFETMPENVYPFPPHCLSNVPVHMLSHNWRDMPKSQLAVSHLGEVYNKKTHSLCEVIQSPYNPIAFAAIVDPYVNPNTGRYVKPLRDVATLVAEHFLQFPPYQGFKVGLTNLDTQNPYPTVYNLAYLPLHFITKCGYSEDEAKLILDWTEIPESSDYYVDIKANR